MQEYTDIISRESGLRQTQVQATLNLLAEGATVPFIARYRKELTGSLDEVNITMIRERSKKLKEMDDRRKTILKSIEEQGKLTPELRRKIMNGQSLTELEDIYLPYKPKRRTRATIAREKGLEPLAKRLMEQNKQDAEFLASHFVDSAKEVHSTDEALAGARDIIAEWVNENQSARTKVRRLYEREGIIRTKLQKGKEEEGAKYREYFDREENLMRAPSHRVLAMRRAEKEKIISLSVSPPQERVHTQLERMFVKGYHSSSEVVKKAVHDSFKRLMGPSMETEIRVLSKRKADAEAITVFTENLRQLLMAAPLGQKRVLALDPGFRTGCKVVCLDAQGKLLINETIYPHPPQRRDAQAASLIASLVNKHKIDFLAVGNGTAGRETETFLRDIDFGRSVPIVMVNESGASIYSASEAAREEFPDYDITVRGAVSIGRRLMDPLAELVKIDPKSIGVGQYQHDVDQSALKQSLDDTVISCVNGVGVEVNTASKQLLTYVSGLGPSLAKNIVEFRDKNGPFSTRKQLKKVPRLGEKAFEQAAGFLRIRDAKNPLDASAVHPESYWIVEKMAKDLGCSVQELMQKEELRRRIDLKRYVTDTVGMPTLKDILAELSKPGRDPRDQFEIFQFAEGINEMKDLREGMELPGIVTNITRFGCFVDIGVHQDGMVHISELANRFVKDPSEVVKVHQKVQVKVVEVDFKRNRIALSMKQVRGNR